jgi:hypothetical protein
MAVKTNAIVEGVVSRVTQRAYPAIEGKREAGTITEVLVVGDYTLASCTLGRGVEVPTHGQFITALVEIDIYRDDDSVKIVEYIDPVVKAGSK